MTPIIALLADFTMHDCLGRKEKKSLEIFIAAAV